MFHYAKDAILRMSRWCFQKPLLNTLTCVEWNIPFNLVKSSCKVFVQTACFIATTAAGATWDEKYKRGWVRIFGEYFKWICRRPLDYCGVIVEWLKCCREEFGHVWGMDGHEKHVSMLVGLLQDSDGPVWNKQGQIIYNEWNFLPSPLRPVGCCAFCSKVLVVVIMKLWEKSGCS